MKLITLIIY